MLKKFAYRNPYLLIFLLGFICFLGIFVPASRWPLQGIHSHRQADTLFAAYSYCYENTPFLTPKIAHRADTTGVSIGEFPLFSYLLSLPCKVTGTWSDPLLQFISLLISLLCTVAWGIFLKKKYFPETKHVLSIWAGVFFFITGHLIHFTVPMPDAFAALIIALAAIVDKPQWQRRALSYTLFALAFVIRPYLFPLAFLAFESPIAAVGAIAVCGGPYLFWYKYWIQQSEINYYATDVKKIGELIHELPRALKNAPIIFLRNHLNFVLLIPFIRGIGKRKKWALLCLLSWIMVTALKGDHYVYHSYYLGAASIFAAALVLAGLTDLNRWQQISIICLSIFIGLASNQHLWTSTKGNYYFKIQEVLRINKVPDNARIAAYVNQAPHILYWARKTGWTLPPTEAHGKCPSPAVQFKLFLVNDQVRIEPCP